VSQSKFQKNSLYPNPVKAGNSVLIKTYNTAVPRVYNAIGQSIKVNLIQNQEGFVLSTNDLPSGIYSIQVNNQTQRLVVSE